MEFCPTYGMLLKYELPNLHLPARFFCPTCPYVGQIEQKVGSKESNVCPDCGHNKVAYIKFQTKPANEPLTINFTCEKCGKCWRED
ncbi:uncharacterized protein LOC111913953 [Lactuca sativa]|uniref:uncharacterized protein LOC111913953 n=1 Tax=Lactuca sativa TaxID=4236 RepID=UPI000CD95C66|nr:uncharacterized protein LOC111913953 [Lactuca sativa]